SVQQGAPDDLSVDDDNTVTGVYDTWGNFHEIQEGVTTVVQGEYGKLYINGEGQYSYAVENWGDVWNFTPTASDFSANKPQITRDNITLTVDTPLYGSMTQGLLTWNANGIGVTGNGNNKINPGEVVQFDFA
ncbi:MAG: hypothetical protein CUN56_16525, partial [Phototrophicales bacterium]